MTTSTILIIEDDYSIAHLQKDYLEINNMSVTIITDGKEGLDNALTHHYDLIIVDIMLPTMDGFEICKRIREKKDTPIMIVSAKREDFDKVRGLGLGADDYLVKPFSPNELVARVKAHINRHQTLKPVVIEKNTIDAEGIFIDKDAHKVFVLNKEIIFTNKEFALLLFLMEHPNRVWSKDDLFELLWNQDTLGTDLATIVVHIKRIREKLKNGHLIDDPIETIWGSGYRFNSKA